MFSYYKVRTTSSREDLQLSNNILENHPMKKLLLFVYISAVGISLGINGARAQSRSAGQMVVPYG